MEKMAKKGKKAKTEDDENSGKKESTFWTPQMDDAYIKAMLKEQDKGNRTGGTFSPLAYKNMVVELNEKLKLNLTKNNLLNRIRTIKKRFSSCYDVFRGQSLSGFSWNPVNELFEAEDEVWKDLIEANPDALDWKTKTISNYNELYMLFAKDRASGVGSETAKERRLRMMNSEDVVEIDDDMDEFQSTNNKIGLDNLNNGDDIQVTTTPKCSQMKPKKKKKVEEESDIASIIQSSFEHVADAMKECTKAIVGSRPPVYSGGEIYSMLELMGVDQDLKAGAFVFLLKSPESTRALMDCPLDMQKSILNEMMGTRN